MKFAIITHVEHKLRNNEFFAYEPYVREMNLWGKYVDEVRIVAPISKGKISTIEIPYEHQCIKLINIKAFNILTVKDSIKAIISIPKTCFLLYKTMKWADHIHLRCPGNIGLLGCFVQMIFPSKPKTVKYAGNWDPKSNQPFSYKIQKWIVSNTYLAKNTKVLVYGEWPNQSKNISPFFTASYSESEKEVINKKGLSKFYRIKSNEVKVNLIKFLFVGTLSKGKQPLLAVEIVHQLKLNGYPIHLDIYGEGVERTKIKNYIKKNSLENEINIHGNVDKEVVKKAYQQAHFLLFISNSEGWPKVVAEAMFWACLPVTSNVSCIPFMLDNGNRGAIVNVNVKKIVSIVEEYIQNNEKYEKHVINALDWSRQFTMEKFEKEIYKLIIS